MMMAALLCDYTESHCRARYINSVSTNCYQQEFTMGTCRAAREGGGRGQRGAAVEVERGQWLNSGEAEGTELRGRCGELAPVEPLCAPLGSRYLSQEVEWETNEVSNYHQAA